MLVIAPVKWCTVVMVTHTVHYCCRVPFDRLHTTNGQFCNQRDFFWQLVGIEINKLSFLREKRKVYMYTVQTHILSSSHKRRQAGKRIQAFKIST